MCRRKGHAFTNTDPQRARGLVRHSSRPRPVPTPTRIRLDPSSSICSWCKLLMFSILLILLLTKKSFFSRLLIRQYPVWGFQKCSQNQR